MNKIDPRFKTIIDNREGNTLLDMLINLKFEGTYKKQTDY